MGWDGAGVGNEWWERVLTKKVHTRLNKAGQERTRQGREVESRAGQGRAQR